MKSLSVFLLALIFAQGLSAQSISPMSGAGGMYDSSGDGGGGTATYIQNNGSQTLYVTTQNRETSVVIKTSSGTYSGYGSGGVTDSSIQQYTLAPGASFAVYAQGWSSPNYLLTGSGSFNYGVSTTAYVPATNYFSYTMNDNAISYYSISATTPIVYTNFTMTIKNDMSVNGVATWTYNGSVVKTETLSPGQSDSWTTPDVEVSPVPGSATWGDSLTPVGNSISYGGDGSPQFIGGSTGGGVSGGGTISGGTATAGTTTGSGTSGGGGSSPSTGGGTTLTSGTNSQVVVSTNVISWSPPSGVASESTLEAAATLAHQDSLNLLQGEAVLHNDLGLLTNQFGQMVGLSSSNNALLFNADTYLQSIASNTAAAVTNQNSIVLSNLVLTVSNSPLVLSNYATETTQSGISNLIASALTNNASTNQNFVAAQNQMLGLIPSSATNASDASAAAVSNVDVSGVTALIDQLVPEIPPDAPNAPNWNMNFCGQTINLDPVAEFPACFNASYIGWSVVLLLAFLYESSKLYLDLVGTCASTSTGGVPDLEIDGMLEILGCGGSVGGNFIGAALAVVIPTAFIAIFAVPMAWLFSHLGISISQAMNISAFTGALGNGYYLLVSGFPLNLAFTLFCTAITLRFTIGKLFQLACAAARYLWGK